MSIFSSETSAGGVVVWTATSYCRGMQENHGNQQKESDIAQTSEPYTCVKSRDW